MESSIQISVSYGIKAIVGLIALVIVLSFCRLIYLSKIFTTLKLWGSK